MKNPFISATTKLGPLTLRDLTALDCVCMAELGSEMSNLESIVAMVWIASQPVEAVEQELADNTAKTSVKEFLRVFPFRLLDDAAAWVAGQKSAQTEAQVTVISRNTEDSDAPKN